MFDEGESLRHAPSCRRSGSPWSDARYKPARAAGSAASGIRCSSPETRPQFGSSKRSDGALPPGGSALGAVAEVHDTVAEPVFLQQLQLGAGVAGEMRACLDRRAPDK